MDKKMGQNNGNDINNSNNSSYLQRFIRVFQ
ncbi:MAG: hypothetical protein ACJAWQ_001035 [Paraglaciecola sp.]|jgi:hypothetical protein